MCAYAFKNINPRPYINGMGASGRTFFIVMALTVIAAGCVSPFDSFSGGPGVSASSLSFSPSKVNSNQLAKLSVSVENQGDYEISEDDGYMYLFGLPLPDDWKIESGETTQTFGLMQSQVRGGRQYAGEKKDFQWVLRAPGNLPRDESFSYTAQARVCYPYKTKVWGKVEVISEDEWLDKQPRGRQIEYQQTRGPIKIDMISTQPLVGKDDTKIKLRITNSGDGTVTSNKCGIFDEMPESGGGESGDSNDGASASAAQDYLSNMNLIKVGNTDCTFEEADGIYLQKGKSKEVTVNCDLPPLEGLPSQSDDFSIEFEYNYYTDRSASILVVGTGETGTGGGVKPPIQLKDQCTALCKASGQTYGTPAQARGICRPESEPSAYDYPPGNTYGFQMLLEPLGMVEVGREGTKSDSVRNIQLTDLLKIISAEKTDALAALTIKDLKLHDVRFGDFSKDEKTAREDGTLIANGLLDITIGSLNKGDFTKQYNQDMFEADTDKDGLPDWFEESMNTKTISADKKDADGNTIKDPDEKNSNGKTYLEIYNDEKNSATARTFGIAKYLCENYNVGNAIGKDGNGKEIEIPESRSSCNPESISAIKLIDLASISINEKEYKPLKNNGDAEKLRNLPIESARITAIGGFKIADISNSNPSRKIRGVQEINIGDIYLKNIPSISANNRLQNFLKYSFCSGVNNAPAQYSRNTVCKCLRDASANKLKTWQGGKSDNKQCNAECKTKFNMAGGGECSPAYAKYTGPICKGSNVMQIRSFDTNKPDSRFGCISGENCICFEKQLGALSKEDVPLVCEQIQASK